MNWMLISLAVLAFFMSIFVYIIFRRKKYTRERYAFFATGFIVTYTLTVMSHIFLDLSLLKILFLVYNQLPFDNLPIPTTGWPEKAWSILFLMILCTFVYGMFKVWSDDGVVSTTDSRMKEVQEELTFMRAVIAGMSLSKIEIANRSNIVTSAQNKVDFGLDFLDQPRDWPTETCELLQMFSHQFSISDNEWHKEKECFFSSYMEKPLLVICSINMLNDADILAKINHFNLNSDGNEIKVILSIKEGECDFNKKVGNYNVECFSKTYLLNNLVNFSEYNSYLHKQFFESEISEGDGVKLEDIYVESEGVLTGLTCSDDSDDSGYSDEKIESVENFLMSWARSKRNEEQIALLGEYGQGKSVLSLKFANELIKSDIKRQPIIIELRGKSPRNMPMEELIAAWAYRLNYNVKAILKLLQEGRLIIILEGFDELDMVGDKLRRLEHFKKLWEFALYEKSKVVITGRPNLFLDNEEARNYLQLDSGSSSTFNVKAIKLEAFNRSQIELALRSSKKDIRNSILRHYDRTEKGIGFSDLISRPSTLFQTSIIWDSLDKSKLSSSKIINGFIDHAYKRQAQKLLLISRTNLEQPILTPNERSYFMLGIAVGMVKHGDYSNQILGDKLLELVRRLYHCIPSSCSTDHHSDSSCLNIRLQDDAVDSIYNDVRTSGILVRDLNSHNSFKFAHKSFLESLFSNFVKDKIKPNNKNREEVVNCIMKALTISDIYSLSFNNEVIEHVTESIIDKKKAFGDEEAIGLLNKLCGKFKFIDLIYFRTKLKISISMLVALLLTSGLVFTVHFFNMQSEAYLHRKIEVTILLYTSSFCAIYIYIYQFIGVWIWRTVLKNRDAIEIWIRSCIAQGYDVRNERVLTNKIIRFDKKDYLLSVFDKLIAYIFIPLLRKK